jgi:hypothetical protein
MALTSEYTVVHATSLTTVTFINPLFNDQAIIVQYNQGSAFEAGVYCTTADVFSWLQLGKSSNADFTGLTDFSTATNPTKDEVTQWINQNEDEIDDETMHAWRETTVTKETHHLEYPAYQTRDGSEIILLNRKIKTLTAGTDLLEVFNGSEYEDYLTTKTEGRDKDYWVDEQMGIIFIKTYTAFLPRFFGVRVTYRFGETTVKKDIQRACILLTASDVLQSDDRTVLLPEGSSNIPMPDKSTRWRKQAEKLISRNREQKVIQT